MQTESVHCKSKYQVATRPNVLRTCYVRKVVALFDARILHPKIRGAGAATGRRAFSREEANGLSQKADNEGYKNRKESGATPQCAVWGELCFFS